MGISVNEQETVISMARGSDTASIYTSDTVMMARLDKLAANGDAPLWRLKEEHYLRDGTLAGKTYTTNKRLISFRTDLLSSHLTEEQRAANRERLLAYQARRNAEREAKNVDG